jgi:AcrR family transcriptional regulator
VSQRNAARISREDVARTAMEFFAARGYRGVSLDMIATELAVTRQALLYYFPTKIKLLLAVLELRDEQDTALFTRLAKEKQWTLDQAIAAIMRHQIQHPELARLYTVLAAEAIEPEHPAHDWFVNRYRRMRTQIAHTGDAADARATVVLALLDGLLLQSFLEPGVVGDDAIAMLQQLVAREDGTHTT